MGVVRDGVVTPVCPVDTFYADVAAGLQAATSAAGGERALDACELVPFVPRTSRVLCVGLNYKSHAAETSLELPAAPNIFARWASTLAVDGDTVPLPPAEPRTIGRCGQTLNRQIAPKISERGGALSHVRRAPGRVVSL